MSAKAEAATEVYAQSFAKDVLLAFRDKGHYSNEEIASSGGPSTSTVTKLRKAASGKKVAPFRRDSLDSIDRGLGWKPNSARQLLEKGTMPDEDPHSPVTRLSQRDHRDALIDIALNNVHTMLESGRTELVFSAMESALESLDFPDLVTVTGVVARLTVAPLLTEDLSQDEFLVRRYLARASDDPLLATALLVKDGAAGARTEPDAWDAAVARLAEMAEAEDAEEDEDIAAHDDPGTIEDQTEADPFA